MSAGYMVKTAGEFFAALDGAQKKLKSFSQELSKRNDSVFSALEEFEKGSRKVEVSARAGSSGPQSSVDLILQKSLQDIRDSIQQWHEQIKRHKKGQQFINKHEKYICVMVFGAVKSGKSSLGNLLAGREWLSAPFDNEYKHRPAAEMATEEKGRDTGDIEIKNGRSWFCEGVTDTTGDIQYFSLSGLRWFDSPGIGAMKREGDRRNMEEMVKECLPYVDIAVFLMNSAEPGLQEDMKYIERLSRDGQEALVVITKSDKYDTDVDDDWNLVKVLSAKSQETRTQQESKSLERLAKEYPNIDKEKYRALSLSTHLAKEGLKQSDEQLFRDSHIDLLMNKIRDKASSDVVGLKASGPKKALNKFIRGIINGDEDIAGIKTLDDQLSNVLQEVSKYQGEIDGRTNRLVKKISRYLRQAVSERLSAMAQETRASGRQFGSSEITQEVSALAEPIIVREIQQEVSGILDESGKMLQSLSVNVSQPAIKTGGISQKTGTFTTSHTTYYVVERDTRGFGEWCGKHILGKRYYETRTSVEEVTHTFNAGTNIEQVIGEIIPQLEGYAERTVRKNLEKIAVNFFRPQQQYVEQMRRSLQQLKEQLESCRFGGI